MNHWKHAALLFCVLTLAACQTMRAVQEDIGNLPNTSLTAEDQSKKLLGSCPVVEIVQDLAVYSDFAAATTSAENLVSSVGMARTQTTCGTNKRSVTVDIGVAFDGVLGPRGRQSSGDKPFFTYPYFVAVTDPSGRIMAKEIFAASLTFEPGEDRHVHEEKLRHIIPLENPSNAGGYRVLIGFQLSPDQLEYNRMAIKQAKAQSAASAATQEKLQAIDNAGAGVAPVESAPVQLTP